MSRDLTNDNYYITSGGKIPVKWTAPEVCIAIGQYLATYVAIAWLKIFMVCKIFLEK